MDQNAEIEPDGWWNDPTVASWDWKEHPGIELFNPLLEPYGVRFVEIDTQCDTYAVRVERITS
jgi:hypothetical protein